MKGEVGTSMQGSGLRKRWGNREDQEAKYHYRKVLKQQQESARAQRRLERPQDFIVHTQRSS